MKLHMCIKGSRNLGGRGTRVMKSALFVQANVAVNTKLTSKVPFLFENLVKNV
jgi:hypothetical protein